MIVNLGREQPDKDRSMGGGSAEATRVTEVESKKRKSAVAVQIHVVPLRPWESPLSMPLRFLIPTELDIKAECPHPNLRSQLGHPSLSTKEI